MTQIIDTQEIQPGDTLSGIASDRGLSLEELLDANRQILEPSLIFVGERINIPGADAAQPRFMPAAPVADALTVFDGIHPAPGTVSLSRANFVHPPLTNTKGNRSAEIYSQVINQFAVGNNPRYLAGRGKTYCNIFMWDVTRAMDAEIPHWIDDAGDIATPGERGAQEITINGGIVWLNRFGDAHGWNPCSQDEAQDAANQGKVAVVTFKNPTGHGHTAVVRPGNINSKGATTAQAGRHNFNLGHVRDGFGNLSPLQFFRHD